ncbi:MAG: rhomboid family intramembrane serine protease [Leadbetterella sp.]|nr:rhomboid family intramembrane serine protease [Leadbetterella sp.]
MGKVFTDIVDVFKRNSNQATQLIIINVAVFFGFTLIKFGVGLIPDATLTAETISRNYLTGSSFMELIRRPWTLLFHPFTQEGLFSLLFDLIIIYWFGNMLADFIGGRKMLITYLSGSYVAIVFFPAGVGLFYPAEQRPWLQRLPLRCLRRSLCPDVRLRGPESRK